MTLPPDAREDVLIRSERDAAVLQLRLNRSGKRNAVNDALLLQLEHALTQLDAAVRCIVLSGEGQHFCAGLDLAELAERSVYEGVLHSRMWHAVRDKLQYAPVPVVAVLHGAVIGGGLEIAAAAHIRVAERGAYYGLPEGQRPVRRRWRPGAPAAADRCGAHGRHDAHRPRARCRRRPASRLEPLDYLFWEGSACCDSSFDHTSGYIVQRDTLADFFEHVLTQMNLTPRERQDFITYWCPRMIQNEFNYIHFSSEQEYNSIATMNITPQPDEVFRVFMIWSKADPKQNTVERSQDLPRASREGFTVVEWGGAEISNNEL